MVILRGAVFRLFGFLALAGIFTFTSGGCGEFAQNAPSSNGSKPAMAVKVALSQTPSKPGSAGDGGPLSAAQISAITCLVTADDMEDVTQSIPIDTLQATLTVPAGYARTFTVTVDTANDGSFSDSQTVDLVPNASIDLVFSLGIYTVAGTISGLHNWMILQNNGGDDLTITKSGAFEFDTSLADGSDYNVTILTASGEQISTVTNGSGTLSGSNVTDIEIACVNQNYAVGGAVGGLASGGTLILQNNAGDDLTLTLDGFFTFSSEVEDLLAYDVTVLTQPVGQTCTVTNASGSIEDTAVTDVTVTCVDNPPEAYSVGGAFSGLGFFSTVVLQNNGGDDSTVGGMGMGSGTFTFATTLINGDSYDITVLTNPSGQTCAVTNGSGTINAANITDVTVACANIPTYTVGGSVSASPSYVPGLALQNNGGDNLTISAVGSFTFATPLVGGADYVVTVLTHPTGQTCAVTGGSGTIVSANVTNVTVTCTDILPNYYTVGGTVSDLVDTLTLQNNSGDNLIITADGSFTFPTALVNGSGYNATILTQPTGQTCSLTNGSGTIASTNVTNVTVTCTNIPYSVGGAISGLGATVVLQNNGGDDLTLTANAGFTFATTLINGNAYSVTVSMQPIGQTCVVTNASGTINAGNVTNVTVTCTDNFYTVGGATSGLSSWLILQNNGGDDLTVTSNGSFTFDTALVNGSGYSVTILTQPVGQTCAVTNASGTISAGNVTDVTVTCTNNFYTVSVAASGLSAIVVLQNNASDNLSITANSVFTFAASIANGSSYNVTILSSKPSAPLYTVQGQTCTLTNASGTINAANVTDITLTCSSGER